MIVLTGGTYMMGATDFYPEEGPRHRVKVDEFSIDECPVTNAEFRRFVEDTGYLTVAERPVKRVDYPDAHPSLLVPGSLVFHLSSRFVDMRDAKNWWSYVPGAAWEHPEGPASNLAGRGAHPVVHVAYEDAVAYARWAGKELPTEAEWEYGARAGLDSATYAWGDEFAPAGQRMANVWEGEFPWQRLGEYESTSPVKSFPPNGYGIYDMIGNVWEWTQECFEPIPVRTVAKSCCSVGGDQSEQTVRRVVKGGSHLCAPNYCRRYRPAARQGETVDTSASHIGFRCVVRSVSGRSGGS